MNITPVLYAILTLGGLGVLFGLILSFADKKFAVLTDERVDLVRVALPGANCGGCGFAGCDAFAKAIVEGNASLTGCMPGGAASVNAIAEIMGIEAEVKAPMVAKVLCQGATGVATQRYDYDGYQSCQMASTMAGGPKQCLSACLGLGDCVNACVFGALSLENGLVKVNENKCTACGTCASLCPRHSIQVLPKDSTVTVLCQNHDGAKAARAQCLKACIACSRCVKACEFDAITLEDACAKIIPEKCTHCGACAAVCPMGCIGS